MRKAAIATALILILTVIKINGQWSTDPNENLEVNPWGVFVTACSDGEGGAYIGWKNFDYYYTRAYLQYVDKYGYVQWDEPLMILDKGDLQYEPFLIEDGEGNCIVTVAVSNIIEILPGGTKLLDYTNYIQKINKNGTLLWDTNAVRLTLNDRDQYTPSIVTDQKGGALFCWYEAIINNDESSFARYYTQHIQSNGIRTWSDTGKVIMDSLTQPLIPMAVSDGAGGMIVYYGDDFQQINNTYFERIDFFGNSLWKTPSKSEDYNNIISNHSDEVLITRENDSNELLYNFISFTGDYLWEYDNKLVENVQNPYLFDKIYNREEKSYVLGWGIGEYTNQNLYLQIIDSTYTFKFDSTGIPISQYVSPKSGTSINKSDSSIIVTWIDERDSQNKIFAQKLDYEGNRLWDINDVLITNRESDSPIVISDKNDGVITAFTDDEPWGPLIAQNLNKEGEIGIVLGVSSKEFLIKDFYLMQNYPNPFNPSTKIKFYLERKEYAELTVYNLLGEKITTLFKDYAEPGTNIVTWDGTDSRGKKQASGVYLITLQAGSYRHTIKSVLIK